MALVEDRRGLRADHREHGLVDAGGLRGGEMPLVQRSQLDLEKGVNIGNRELKRPGRQGLVDDLTIRRSRHTSTEGIGRLHLLPTLIHRSDGCDPVPEHRPRGNGGKQGRLKEREALYLCRSIERPLQRNSGAVRVPGDMRPGDTEVSEQSAAISSLLPYREWGSGTGTTRKAAAVIRDHAIVVGDAGLSPQGEERIREDAAVDQ